MATELLAELTIAVGMRTHESSLGLSGSIETHVVFKGCFGDLVIHSAVAQDWQYGPTSRHYGPAPENLAISVYRALKLGSSLVWVGFACGRCGSVAAWMIAPRPTSESQTEC